MGFIPSLVAIFVYLPTKMRGLYLLLNKSNSSFQLDCKRDASANVNGDDQTKQVACYTLDEQAKKLPGHTCTGNRITEYHASAQELAP